MPDSSVWFSPLAENDLEEIWRYTFETWSIEQADRYVTDILSACKAISGNPKLGRRIDVREGYLKYPVGSHFVFYRMRDHTIEVIRILHQRMDVQRHL
jgi:toxin ParE1/3/4